MANQETGVKRWMLSSILGKMMFAAINLTPTESIYSSETPQAGTPTDTRYVRPNRTDRLHTYIFSALRGDFMNSYPLPPREAPLTLWGLTLGVVSDFLDAFPPHTALTLWTYPTFTPLDVRFTIWLLTHNFAQRKRAELQAGSDIPAPTSQHSPERASYGAATESVVVVHRPDETGLHGLGTGLTRADSDRKAAVSTMLEGFVFRTCGLERLLPVVNDRARYYDLVRRAVVVALVGRASLLFVIGVVAWRRLRRRRM